MESSVTLTTIVTYLLSVYYVLGTILHTLHVLKLHLTFSPQSYEKNIIILSLKHRKLRKLGLGHIARVLVCVGCSNKIP